MAEQVCLNFNSRTDVEYSAVFICLIRLLWEDGLLRIQEPYLSNIHTWYARRPVRTGLGNPVSAQEISFGLGARSFVNPDCEKWRMQCSGCICRSCFQKPFLVSLTPSFFCGTHLNNRVWSLSSSCPFGLETAKVMCKVLASNLEGLQLETWATVWIEINPSLT
jgi:hypothetical protein